MKLQWRMFPVFRLREYNHILRHCEERSNLTCCICKVYSIVISNTDDTDSQARTQIIADLQSFGIYAKAEITHNL